MLENPTPERFMSRGLVTLFFVYTLFSVAGLLLLRRWLPAARTSISTGDVTSHTTILAAAGAIAYVISFLTWMVIVARVPVARAYPISVGLTLTFTALGARLLLHEPFTGRQLAGTVVIFGGVLLLTLPSG